MYLLLEHKLHIIVEYYLKKQNWDSKEPLKIK